MDCDIIRITAESCDVFFDPVKCHSLISESCILARQGFRLGETKDAQSVVEADVYDWKAIVDGFNDETARLRCQFVLCTDDVAAT